MLRKSKAHQRQGMLEAKVSDGLPLETLLSLSSSQESYILDKRLRVTGLVSLLGCDSPLRP